MDNFFTNSDGSIAEPAVFDLSESVASRPQKPKQKKSSGNCDQDTYSSKAKGLSFSDYCASRFTSPDQILQEYFEDLKAVGASKGYVINELPTLDGVFHYITKDSKQGCLAEYKESKGVVVPTVTLNNFKINSSLCWNPRDLIFKEYEAFKENPSNTIDINQERREQFKATNQEAKDKQDAINALLEIDAAKGRKAAAQAACEVFEDALPVDECNHEYLQRKGVQGKGLRIATKKTERKLYSKDKQEWRKQAVCLPGELIIPIYKSDAIINIQRISRYENKKKYFLAGGELSSAYYLIEGEGDAYIAEGYATAATIHEATGNPVYVAFSASNIKKVTDSLPGKISYVAADNDKSRTGLEAAEITGLPYYLPPDVGDDWNDYGRKHGLESVRELLAEEPIKETLKPKSKGLLIHPSEFFSPSKPPEWTISGIIESESIAMLFGPSGGGKSFIAISMACSIVSGSDWYGHKVKQGPVIYSNGEGFTGLKRRFKAWSLDNDVDLSKFPIYPTRRPVLFGDPDSIKTLNDEIDTLPEKPILIIIDTLARSTVGMEENSAKDMGEFVHAIDELKRKYKCTVLIVHHTGQENAQRARGSSAIKAALDVEMSLETPKGGCRLRSTKAKESEPFKTKTFTFETIVLPDDYNDVDGNQMTSAVLNIVDETNEKTKSESNASQKESEALKCLVDVQNEQINVITKNANYDPENLPSVTRADWIQRIKDNNISSGSTHISRLIKKGLVEEIETKNKTYRPL